MFYARDGRYVPLPECANYFISVGEDAATSRNFDEQLVLALALPTRAYVAALIALGVVRTILVEPPKEKDLAEVWHNIALGTPVFVKEGTKRVKGQFDGLMCNPPDNRPRIGVCFPNKKGWPVNYFLPENCIISSLPSGSTMVLPRPNPGDEIVNDQRFITGFIPQGNLNTMLTKSHLNCLIVGHLNILRSEIRDTTFAVGLETIQDKQAKSVGEIIEGKLRFDEGTLNDVLRVRKFSSPNQTFMTDIFPVDARTSLKDIDCNNTVIIYDGAASFLRWRNSKERNVRIILLDRTESHFDTAVQVLNSDYIARASDPTHFKWKNVPSSIETMSFLGGS